MYPKRPISGIIPAVLFPRDENGRARWEDFESTAVFLKSAGVAGLCVNGATGEYAAASAGERLRALEIARAVMGTDGLVVAGAGAAFWTESARLAREAEAVGADVHLVPVPHFFPYEPGDVAEFYLRMSDAVEAPILIYNLPAFTTGVETSVALDLIRGDNRVAGIKDSSGSLAILEALTADGPAEAIRLVGHDGVVAEGLSRGLCQGAISGPAGVIPEMTVTLWRASESGDKALFQAASQVQDELLAELAEWPVPWGLKLMAECRGLGPSTTPLPLSAHRRERAARFQQWFRQWWPGALTRLGFERDPRG
jgi:4-hydroxy-tetrahydrodipicolinate synthase